ncbi:hypothetical protein PG995_000107 [Apiospora arundinis]
MSPSEPEVLAALAAYRSHISSLNHRAFSAMIPEIEAAGLDDPDHFESKEKRETRLEFLLNVVGAERDGTSPPITRPSDLLTHWEALAPQLALDGASACPDSFWRDEMRGAYMRGILRGLNERCSGSGPLGGDITWEFPTDLAVILQQVDSLEGPGWCRYRDQCETVIFLEGWVRDGDGWSEFENEESAAALVKTPDEVIGCTQGLEDEYEIAGGWACGDKGNEATCYVVYSRPRDGGEEEEEVKEQSWSWRYVATLGQFGEEVFEDVVAMLEWYKSYDEPQEQDWEILPGKVFRR